MKTTQVHWQEIGDGTWVLYDGNEEIFRAQNEEGMTAIMDFAKSTNYHYFISLNSNVDVVSVDGRKLKRVTGPRMVDWSEFD